MTHNIIDMSVEDWLRQKPAQPVLVSTNTPLNELALLMLDNNSRDAYVMEGGVVLGHVSFNNVVNHLFTQDRPIHTHRQIFARVTKATAAELMDPHYAYCRGEELLCDVMHRQLERGVDDLIVLAADNTLQGVIKLSELIRESLK